MRAASGEVQGQHGFTRVPTQSTHSDAMVFCQPQPHRNRNGMGQGRLADGVRNMSLLNPPNAAAHPRSLIVL